MRIRRSLLALTIVLAVFTMPIQVSAANPKESTIFNSAESFASNGPYLIGQNSGLIYYQNPDGSIFKDGVAPDGCFYDPFGTQVNTLTFIHDKYIEQYRDAAPEASIVFDNQKELELFINYLQLNVSDRQGESFVFNKKPDGHCEIIKNNIMELETADNEYTTKIADEISGQIPSHYSTAEKTNYATIQVARYLSYDSGYEKLSMTQSLMARKGVCYHFAKLLKAVLMKCNIESEFMIGDYSGSGIHCWLQIYDNSTGKYLYRDPTIACSDLNNGLFPVNTYEVYLALYRNINLTD